MEAKRARRIHLGDYLTFLFENRLTLGYQIQEIMRIEQIVREADIAHEIDTYNQLLGQPGDLGCVLQIEVTDPVERASRLESWRGLQEHVYVRLDDGQQIFADFDARQVGSDRLSAVQYLRFAVEGRTPTAIGTDFGELESEVELNAAQMAALTEDLAQR